MKVTIKDIAKKVGVNPSTVSRVINGTASISEETKRRIFDAMQEMDYHPNSLARSLVNGSTFTIGLVIDAGNSDAFSNNFFVNSVSAIERITQERGYNLLITNDANYVNENAVKDLIMENKVDGVILPVSSMDSDLVDLLIGNNFPFVVMGEPQEKNEKIFWVDMDNKQGSLLAVEHLVKQGYHRPVLIVENKGTMFEKNRIQGFVEGLEKGNMEFDMKCIIECESKEETVVSKVKELLSREDKPDSIICTNNIMAFHVLKGLRKEGIKIPQEIGVMTFDNYPLAEYMEPALSVIDIDTFKLGEQAATALFAKIKNEENNMKNTLISTQIIARESTRKEKQNE